MGKQATATVAYTCQGDGLVANDSLTVTNTTAVAPTSQTLAAGDNTITLPSGTLRVRIVPPPSNTQSLTLKGVTGDTGLALNVAEPTYLSFAGSVTSFCLTAGGAVTVLFEWV